ncbi:hypothetical protein P5X10_20935, partial [Enterobacter hormaechei]|uniref:hypothetical protein n=1 Tax=Enterobacter hormaechei TaxID=158836 RepID=UPI00240279E7
KSFFTLKSRVKIQNPTRPGALSGVNTFNYYFTGRGGGALTLFSPARNHSSIPPEVFSYEFKNNDNK